MDEYAKVQELLLKLVPLNAEEREEILSAMTDAHPGLVAEVRKLLPHASDLHTETVGVASDGDDLIGGVIGSYHIIAKLGDGGMGEVYLADQKTPIKRRVALKLIKVGMDTKEVVARFESERQALAMMNHSHVAGIYDAGSTDSGRPYFVMEYVSGEPITDYCDRHKLNLRSRLELFIPVCQAIHHAHQKGIIHRDIKPSNVLVAIEDSRPVPKVIDFGVAKATQQALTEKTMYTMRGSMVGTPAYMSPEQAEMTGLNVDTTTDVYSLGVLLYELLVGARPFDAKELREASIVEIHRIIREVDPPNPSSKISTLGEMATDIAAKRQVRPGSWQRQLNGELDWITMRAMEKNRSRRYQSAIALSDDIQRFLDLKPVVAGPPSVGYLLKKTIRRHLNLFLFTVTTLALLLAGISFSTVGFLRARKAETRAIQAQAESQQKTESLQEIANSMINIMKEDIFGDYEIAKALVKHRAIDNIDGPWLREMDSQFLHSKGLVPVYGLPRSVRPILGAGKLDTDIDNIISFDLGRALFDDFLIVDRDAAVLKRVTSSAAMEYWRADLFIIPFSETRNDTISVRVECVRARSFEVFTLLDTTVVFRPDSFLNVMVPNLAGSVREKLLSGMSFYSGEITDISGGEYEISITGAVPVGSILKIIQTGRPGGRVNIGEVVVVSSNDAHVRAVPASAEAMDQVSLGDLVYSEVQFFGLKQR